jgi:hypothetical protein
MDRAGRVLDICAFLHRNYLVNEQWVTVGEYARYAQMSVSPHLRGIFTWMLDNHILTMQPEPYRAGVMYTFALDYKAIEQPDAAWLKDEMIRRVGWQEGLLI